MRVIRIGRGKRWRVYPSGDTTVAELTGALEAFPVVCVVDEDGAVCLQMIGDRDDGRPSLEELAAALWGPDNTATLINESGVFPKLEIDTSRPGLEVGEIKWKD